MEINLTCNNCGYEWESDEQDEPCPECGKLPSDIPPPTREKDRPQINTLNVAPGGSLHALVRLRDDWGESCIHLLWHTGTNIYESLEAMFKEFLATEQDVIAEVEAENDGDSFSWMDLMECAPKELMAKHNLTEMMIPGNGLGVVIVPSDDPLEEWSF